MMILCQLIHQPESGIVTGSLIVSPGIPEADYQVYIGLSNCQRVLLFVSLFGASSFSIRFYFIGGFRIVV